MKIHSDILTQEQLYAAVPHPLSADALPVGTKSRGHAFNVRLVYYCDIHEPGRRRPNSGTYGAGPERDAWAATWDEWGIWMAALFAIDPNAIIGQYKGVEDFREVTTKYRPRGMKAPWLDEVAS